MSFKLIIYSFPHHTFLKIYSSFSYFLQSITAIENVFPKYVHKEKLIRKISSFQTNDNDDGNFQYLI